MATGTVKWQRRQGLRVHHQLFAAATAMLMPTRWSESLKLVMIQALASGTPVIAFAHGAATDIVVASSSTTRTRRERSSGWARSTRPAGR